MQSMLTHYMPQLVGRDAGSAALERKRPSCQFRALFHIVFSLCQGQIRVDGIRLTSEVLVSFMI